MLLSQEKMGGRMIVSQIPAAGDVTSDLQPTYNPLTGIPTTIEIDISRHIPVCLQPNEDKDKTGVFLQMRSG